MAVVCDGVGSVRDGAFASTYCTGALKKWFQTAETVRLGLSLRDRVLELNEEVRTAAEQKGLDTATTLSGLLLVEKQYVAVHVGDSRIYQWTLNGLRQLTRDDVSPGGRLTACVGRWEQLNVSYDEGVVTEGRFLLCTDGLYKRLSQDVLEKELRKAGGLRLQAKLKKLAKMAVRCGEKDNISAIIVEGER